MLKQHKQPIVALLVYLLGSFLFVLWFYHSNYNSNLETVDHELKIAAVATAELLGKDYHSGLVDAQSINKQKELSSTTRLNRLIENLDIDYVYTLIKHDENILFVAASLKQDEMDAGEAVFFIPYESADQSVHDSFSSGEITYSEYTDRWGHFRSIFVPMQSSDGTPYVSGADIPIDRIKALSRSNTIKAALAWVFLSLIALPLLWNYIRSLKREAKLEIDRLYHDPLTGLPNRYKLITDLENSQHPKLAIVSFDKFRDVNAAYGVAIGDQVLQRFAQRLLHLKHSQIAHHSVYRLHGDTFAFLVDQSISYSETKRIFVKLMDSLASQFYIGDKEIKLTVTIGAVTNVSDPLEMAEMAFYEACETNQPIVTYDNEVLLPEIYQKSIEQATDLQTALDEKRLVPYFMPIMNIETGEIEKHECLARMIDKDGNIVGMPDDFIPIAHRTKLYRYITRNILNAAIEKIRKSGLRLTINLSTTDISDPRTSQYLLRRIKATNTGELLDIEILETERIADYDLTRQFLYHLKSLGCKIGIDDLGRDYSNYERLIKLPFDFIKIDRTIIEHIEEHPEAARLTRELLDLARQYKLKTVAEYCSSEKIFEIVVDLGFDYAQGNYIGSATSEPEFNHRTSSAQLQIIPSALSNP